MSDEPWKFCTSLRSSPTYIQNQNFASFIDFKFSLVHQKSVFFTETFDMIYLLFILQGLFISN